MMNWSDITNFVMLYLTGDAYTVFSRMSTEDKKNWDKIRKALIDSFEMAPYKAFTLAVSLQAVTGTNLDAHLGQVERLMSIVGDRWKTFLFLRSLPESVRAKLLCEDSSDTEAVKNKTIQQ
ncbi:hypothetical protein Ciccas_013704 [Cichlidogyrus casuarinus]|uniref:Uncharacterized protein n=1 Tax=Cichlidogyrus casuarinus TaxID=1844966 RepID=A0ABD2PLQ4_9PLAT